MDVTDGRGGCRLFGQQEVRFGAWVALAGHEPGEVLRDAPGQPAVQLQGAHPVMEHDGGEVAEGSRVPVLLRHHEGLHRISVLGNRHGAGRDVNRHGGGAAGVRIHSAVLVRGEWRTQVVAAVARPRNVYADVRPGRSARAEEHGAAQLHELLVATEELDRA